MQGKGINLDPISGAISVLDISRENRAVILANLAKYPCYSEMLEWGESERQRMVRDPHRIIFNNPLRVESSRDLSAVAFSLTNRTYSILGDAARKAILYHTSRRVSKSYNRETLSPKRVKSILKQDLGRERDDIDISLYGELLATKKGDGEINGLVLITGDLEIVLDLDDVINQFGDIDLFYKVNRSTRRRKRVYMIRCRDKVWSVKNWATPIPIVADEGIKSWETRVKKVLRNRNTFSILEDLQSDPAQSPASDESGLQKVNVLVADAVMKLDTFYAYANEAPCHALNRKSQQTTILKPSRIEKGNPATDILMDSAMKETNKCYSLFQQSLVSYLILIGILNDVSRQLNSSNPDEHERRITASSRGDRLVRSGTY
jgi:hypothetical protein